MSIIHVSSHATSDEAIVEMVKDGFDYESAKTEAYRMFGNGKSLIHLRVTALRQTAIELLRLYRASQTTEPFDPMDADAIAAWERIAGGIETGNDLNVIELRSLDNAPRDHAA
jgi:hypothetical protein